MDADNIPLYPKTIPATKNALEILRSDEQSSYSPERKQQDENKPLEFLYIINPDDNDDIDIDNQVNDDVPDEGELYVGFARRFELEDQDRAASPPPQERRRHGIGIGSLKDAASARMSSFMNSVGVGKSFNHGVGSSSNPGDGKSFDSAHVGGEGSAAAPRALSSRRRRSEKEEDHDPPQPQRNRGGGGGGKARRRQSENILSSCDRTSSQRRNSESLSGGSNCFEGLLGGEEEHGRIQGGGREGKPQNGKFEHTRSKSEDFYLDNEIYTVEQHDVVRSKVSRSAPAAAARGKKKDANIPENLYVTQHDNLLANKEGKSNMKNGHRVMASSVPPNSATQHRGDSKLAASLQLQPMSRDANGSRRSKSTDRPLTNLMPISSTVMRRSSQNDLISMRRRSKSNNFLPPSSMKVRRTTIHLQNDATATTGRSKSIDRSYRQANSMPIKSMRRGGSRDAVSSRDQSMQGSMQGKSRWRPSEMSIDVSSREQSMQGKSRRRPSEMSIDSSTRSETETLNHFLHTLGYEG